MKETINYKGFTLELYPIRITDQGRKQQTVIINKDGKTIKGILVDVNYKNAIEEAKKDIDNIINYKAMKP